MNLVLLTEGTGQGVRGRKTNVSRAYDLLIENGNQRINFEAGPGARFPLALGTFFGRGATAILNHHQNWFLTHAPKRGELKVFLFGFSRGALIMRAFADWLCQRGFPVEYMGLWDTVDSTVDIRGDDYVTLPTNVKFARHAVARDERRKFFGYLPLLPNAAAGSSSGSVEELVFPGSHSDVGGLYEDNHAIADLTLTWILEPALQRGLKVSRTGGEISPKPISAADCVIHDSLKEPTNAWGAIEPVKRLLDGVRRHPICDEATIVSFCQKK